MKYQIIVFDFDYTLFDYEATERIAVKAAFEALNLPYEEQYHNRFKKINRQIWADSERDKRVDKSQLRVERFRILFEQLNIENSQELAERASKEYITQSEHGVLIDGVEETILNLQQRYTLAIASSGLRSPREAKLYQSPIRDAFSLVMFREYFDEDQIKPDRGFFDKIASNYSVPRNEILYVGDSFGEDIRGAKNAGFSTVFFNYFGIPDREIDFEMADHVIDKFSELISEIKL